MASLIPIGSVSFHADLRETNWNGIERHSLDAQHFAGAAAEDDLVDWAWGLIRSQLSEDRFDYGQIAPLADRSGTVVTFYSIETGLPIANLYIRPHRPVISHPAVDLTIRREDLEDRRRAA